MKLLKDFIFHLILSRRRLFDLVLIGLNSRLVRLGVDDAYNVGLLNGVSRKSTNNCIEKQKN